MEVKACMGCFVEWDRERDRIIPVSDEFGVGINRKNQDRK